VYSSLFAAAQKKKGVKLLKMVLMLGVHSPQSIACGVGASVSTIELYNSDRIVSLFMFLYGYCYCYSLLSTICMKLDPGIHIGMHLVCFSKPGVTDQ
jgi:hypothetical protein